MSKKVTFALIVWILIVAAACQEGERVLPTQVVFGTATPTLTPTPTATV
jgi:hypothetical protein